mgnify:CR=1 FL=1
MADVYMNGADEQVDELFKPDDLGLELSVLLSKMGVDKNKVNEIFDVIARVDDPLVEVEDSEPEPEPEPEPESEPEETED